MPVVNVKPKGLGLDSRTRIEPEKTDAANH